MLFFWCHFSPLSQTVSSSSSTCFSKWRRKCFAEGRASAAKSRAIPPPSLVTVWGIQSKVCPVTCSLRNKQPAQSPKTKAIRGGRLVCELNRGTFLKASIIGKKNSELSQWRVTSMAVHWYIDAVNASDSAVKVLRLKLSCYLWHVSLGRQEAVVQRQQPVCFTVIASAHPSSSDSPHVWTYFKSDWVCSSLMFTNCFHTFFKEQISFLFTSGSVTLTYGSFFKYNRVYPISNFEPRMYFASIYKSYQSLMNP